MITDTTIENSMVYSRAVRDKNLIGAVIELCTKCNWKCKHCYLPSHDDLGLSKDKIFDIFNQLRELGCFDITLTGGEMFCRNDIMDIIVKARDMHFNIALYTNISLLDEEKIKELSELYIKEISCTIFSLDEDIHDSITGIKGSLKNAMKNVEFIKKYGIKLEVKTILMKENYDSYKELDKFCKENDFSYRVTSSVWAKHNGDFSYKEWLLSKKQLEKVIPEIDEIMDHKERTFTADSYFCNSVHYSICINYRGKVFPCINMQYVVGDIFEDTIYDIWYKSIRLDKVKELKWRDIPGCLKCDNKSHCDRCAGIVLLETGDIFGKCSMDCTLADIRSKQQMKSK